MEVGSFLHWHPFIVRDKKKKDEAECFLCDLPIWGLSYACHECKWLGAIHKSCAELSTQIRHPFHPQHLLTLGNNSWKPNMENIRCEGCERKNFRFCYGCDECDFKLDFKCAFRAPTVKYEGHEHLLTLYGKNQDLCNSCGQNCYAFVLRCVECDFNLNIDCFCSLPPTIQHKCHIDPLTLMASSVVQEDDDYDEFYCDACEKERNPNLPVYYCAECDYVAHIDCVISEVLPSVLAEQERNTRAKEAAAKLASTAAMLCENVGVKGTAASALAKLDGEIAKLSAELEALMAKLEEREKERAQYVALTAKLGVQEREHAQYVASKMLKAKGQCLSEASTLKE